MSDVIYIKLYKDILKYMIMEYCKEERINIFDIVNSNHLHLTGKIRSDLRRQFLSWKQNNTIGAYHLFIKLYESEEVYDKRTDFFKKYIEEDPSWLNDLSKEPVAFGKYRLHMEWKNEEIESLEKQLDDVEQGKGYMSEETHKELMKQQLDEQQQIIQEQGNTVSKLRFNESCLREKLEAADRRFTAQKKFYEDAINIASSMD